MQFGSVLAAVAVFTLSIAVLTTAAVPEHVCIHDELQAQFPPARATAENTLYVPGPNERRKRDTINYGGKLWDYMRVIVDMSNVNGDRTGGSPMGCASSGSTITISGGASYQCTQDDVLTTEKQAYLEGMLLKAADKLRALRVPTVGTFRTASGVATCASNVDIPQPYRDGVDGTDFLLLVTARPIPPPAGSNGRTLATATTCQTDSDGRPTVGWANFNPSSLSIGSDQDQALQLGVAIHEISHALGFSFGTFSSNSRYKRFDGTNWVSVPSSEILYQSDPGNSNSLYGLKTPALLAFGKMHYNCPTLSFIPLEVGGGGGTAKSHWYKQTLFNEYMTGTASADPVFSNMTLAAFADMGWYLPDFNRAEPLGFGRNQPCSFAQGNCNNWPSTGGYKCSSGIDKSCTADYRSYGMCNSQGTLLLENCPYYQSDTLCTFSFDPNATVSTPGAATETIQKTLNDLLGAGEEYGSESRCFLSSLNRIEKISELVPVPGISTQRCYRTACQGPQKLRVLIHGFHYLCPIAGGDVPVSGFGGTLNCVANMADSICQNMIGDDPDWPILEGTNPTKAKPGEAITITGQNFNKTSSMTIVVEAECTEVVVLNDTHMTAKLPDPKFFYNPRYLNIFGENKLQMGIRDALGRSDAQAKFIDINIEFNAEYLKVVFQWAEDNPLWATFGIIAIAFPCFCLCFCCYRKCRKQKPKRGQYEHNYDANNDDYYYDEDVENEHGGKSKTK